MSALVHELKVQQVELEKQNEALRRAQTSLEAASNKYREFYDLAPVGFVTLNESGIIREVNLTAASQLGVARRSLINKPFPSFIEAEDRDRFRRCLNRVFQEPGPHHCEIKLQRPDGGNCCARLDSAAGHDTGGTPVCRTSISDISDLKQAEQKAHDSERLFASFMGHLPGVAAIRDLEGRYLFANSGWEQTFHRTRDEWRSKTSDELWPPEVAAKFTEQDRLVIETGKPLQSLVTLRQADGLHHWIYYRFPIVDQDRQPVMIGLNAIDVTEAMEIKARLEQVLASAPAAIYTCGAKGDFAPTYISDNVKGLVGWDARDFLADSRFWINHVHPEDLPRILEQFELTRPEDHQRLEYRFLAQDGAYRWMHDEFKLIWGEDGKPEEIAGVWMDVTARRWTEEALKESESHYRLLVKQIPAVVFKGYADWSIDCFDDKIENVTGYRKTEFDSRTLRWCDLILPEDLAEVQERFIEALKTDQAYVREYRIRKKDGEIAWIQARGQICRDAAGKVDYISGVFFDITERKALEAQLLQAQKMEAVGRLAGGVAHDFNNLLMAIMGYGELIRASLVKDDPLYKYSEDILKASERAASLTQQLLAFSRGQVMQPQVINLNRVAADLKKILGRLIGEHIDLEIVAGPDLGAVKADPGQIGQIIMNLAVNARDAMPTGGRLILSTANIDFAASHKCRFENIPPGRYVRLAVRDTGSGMDAETLTHIFEPFFTTKEVGKGTGLGLSMVCGIVKQNRGYLEVESQAGQGATFTIYLPRLEAGVEAVGARMTAAARLEGSETILVVEDEDALRALLCRFFRLYGYNVMEARHGGEALLLAERHPGPIHLMVSDVVMPQMSGKELADRMAPLHPEMTVFFMSGYTDSDLTSYGAPGPSQHFIPKPFRPMDLVKKVRDILDAARGVRADSPPP